MAPRLSPGWTVWVPALDEAVDVAIGAGVAGIVATNTTLSRAGVERHPRATEAGGLSGAPLEARATEVVRRCYARAAGRVPIVGCGGVMDAGGAYAKIRAGASLVQVYTGLVYGGPGLVDRIHAGLARLLERDGFGSVADAVGADHRSGKQPAPGPAPDGPTYRGASQAAPE